MSILGKNTNVLIATFSPWKNGCRLPINGNVEPMIDFFKEKAKKLVLIDQPYPESDFLFPRAEIYENSKKNISRTSFWAYFLYPFLKFENSPGTHISFKIRDLLSVLDFGLKTNTHYDYFIGFEAINALGGIFLKKIGKVDRVIYYVSDYSPSRYSQNWFNKLYLWLDRMAAEKSDVIWDVSSAMQPARLSAGLSEKKSAPVLVVPNALYPYQIKQAGEKDIIPFSLCFMGTLGVENGPDLTIQSLPYVSKKFPRTTLNIVGGNDSDLKRLKNLVNKLKLKDKVIFHGFIADRKKVSEAIRNYKIALAPYKYIKGSARLYGDATKIRAYMAAGLPTITTKVPPLGREIAEKNAGIVVGDTPRALADGIIKIFSDKKLYSSLRKNAFHFAKENTWENEYALAFREMKKIL